MATAPINFLQGSSPMDNITAQLLSQLGGSLRARKDRGIAEERNRLVATQQEDQRQERARQESLITDLGLIESPTFDDYNKVALMLPKERASQIRAGFTQLNKEQQQNQLKSNVEIMASLDFSKQAGIDLLNERAQLERDSGDEEEAAELERMAVAAETDPDKVRTFFGTLTAALPGGKAFLDNLNALKGGGISSGDDIVHSSRILDDGTTQIVRKSGKIEVLSPTEAETELVKNAQVFGASLQGLRSGERDAGKAAIKVSTDAFKLLTPVRKNIAQLGEGIELLGQGAGTGFFEKMIPSIKTASVKLKNLQSRLGLNIIQTTTFGSLSEAELKFALDTAIPLGLDEKALEKWLTEKREAQKKVANILEETAIFLGIPGNTIADFAIKKKGEREGAETQESVDEKKRIEEPLTLEEEAELAELRKRK